MSKYHIYFTGISDSTFLAIVLDRFVDKIIHHQLLTALSAHVLKLFFADKDIFQLSGHQKIHVFAVNPIFFPPIVFKFGVSQEMG